MIIPYTVSLEYIITISANNCQDSAFFLKNNWLNPIMNKRPPNILDKMWESINDDKSAPDIAPMTPKIDEIIAIFHEIKFFL